MKENKEFTWCHLSEKEFKTKEHVSGHLKWLENKTDRSEYEEALYKKLKAEQDGTTA